MNKYINSKVALMAWLFLAMFSANFGSANADNELTEGPGLFSGESGEFSLSDAFQKERKNQSSVKESSTNPRTSNNLGNAEEFELYKQWRISKQNNSKEYREFKVWLEYQNYLRNR